MVLCQSRVWSPEHLAAHTDQQPGLFLLVSRHTGQARAQHSSHRLALGLAPGLAWCSSSAEPGPARAGPGQEHTQLTHRGSSTGPCGRAGAAVGPARVGQSSCCTQTEPAHQLLHHSNASGLQPGLPSPGKSLTLWMTPHKPKD